MILKLRNKIFIRIIINYMETMNIIVPSESFLNYYFFAIKKLNDE